MKNPKHGKCITCGAFQLLENETCNYPTGGACNESCGGHLIEYDFVRAHEIATWGHPLTEL